VPHSVTSQKTPFFIATAVKISNLTIFEYSSSCWDLRREGKINALDRMQNKAAKFAHQRDDLNWETLTHSRKIARVCAFLRPYTGERTWRAISDSQQNHAI
jgi:hypothetical protein